MEKSKNLEQNLDNSNEKLHISDVSIQYCEACDKNRKHTKRKYGLECDECGWLKEQY